MAKLSHHTKDKGDQGLGFVLAALLSHNIQVALPVSEHLPFDLIAISMDGELKKVSVKYRAVKNGKIEVELKSKWSNGQGCHRRDLDRGEVDAHAVYCPDTGLCYFLRDDTLTKKMFTLRIAAPKMGQHKGVRMAEDYTDPRAIFG